MHQVIDRFDDIVGLNEIDRHHGSIPEHIGELIERILMVRSGDHAFHTDVHVFRVRDEASVMIHLRERYNRGSE